MPPESVAITGYYSGTVLSLGDSVSMDCQTCNGNPGPLVKWTDRGMNEDLESSFSADENSCTNVSLVLGPMSREFNNKVFECHAANGINPDKRDSRTLTVHCERG